VRHVLLIGAYRDNEVSSSHPLMRTLTAIREAGAKSQEIVLAPLGLDDVERLVADALHSRPDSAGPLALSVYEKTGGNPFFTIQLLTSLAEEGLLRFDRAEAPPNKSNWTWATPTTWWISCWVSCGDCRTRRRPLSSNSPVSATWPIWRS